MPSNIGEGGSCQKLSIGSTSTQSAVIKGTVVHVTPTVDCFIRDGLNPVALSTGVDHFLVANATQEFQTEKGNILAFITTSAAGTVYISVVG